MGFIENSCCADSVLIRYVTLENRSASTAWEEQEEEKRGGMEEGGKGIVLKGKRDVWRKQGRQMERGGEKPHTLCYSVVTLHSGVDSEYEYFYFNYVVFF